jgi:hypothetical protein
MPPSRSEARLATAVAVPADLRKFRRVNIVGILSRRAWALNRNLKVEL